MALDAVILAELLRRVEPIGSMRFFPESGYTILQADGSEWLRTGLAKPAASYPVAAQCQALQIFGVAATGSGPTAVYGKASNGTGTVVVASGDATNIHVSTDYGATWAAVAHNLGVNCVGVAFNGTTWVAVGNSATSFVISTSTAPGSAWTLRTAPTAFTGGTVDSASICWDAANGKFVAVARGGTTNFAAYSANGTSGWTATNLSVAFTDKTYIAANGGNVVAIGGAVTNKSSNGGVSWSTGTGIGSSANLSVFGGVFVTGLYKSADNGASWQSMPSPSSASDFATSTGQSGDANATCYILGTNNYQFWVTTDMATWRLVSPSALVFRPILPDSGNRLIAVSGDMPRYTSNLFGADYVGTVRKQLSSGASTQTMYDPVAYVRIK